MTLYHVSMDTADTDTVFFPRVPGSASEQEDKGIPRVCLSDSIEHCLQAMPFDSRIKLAKGTRIAVYTVDSEDIAAGRLVTPEELWSRHLVPDAPATREYWSLDPVRFTRKVLCVEDFSFEHALMPCCIDPEDVRAVVSSIFPELDTGGLKTPDDIYGLAMAYAADSGQYDKGDDIWDALAEFPPAQQTVIYGLKLTPVAEQEEDIER